MNTNYQIKGVEKVKEYLSKLPRGTIRTAIAAIGEYLLGNESHGLKHNDPYRYVTRETAYGQTFSSDAQRKYVMGAIARGEITPGKPNRTNASSDGWIAVETSAGYGVSLRNNEAGAYYTRSDKGQARQPTLVGWRKTSQVVKDNINGAMRHATAKVNQWIKASK